MRYVNVSSRATDDDREPGTASSLGCSCNAQIAIGQVRASGTGIAVAYIGVRFIWVGDKGEKNPRTADT